MNIIKKYSFELALCIPIISLFFGNMIPLKLILNPNSLIAGSLLTITGFLLRYTKGTPSTLGYYLLYAGVVLICFGIASLCSETLLYTLIMISGVTGILCLIRNAYFLKSPKS